MRESLLTMIQSVRSTIVVECGYCSPAGWVPVFRPWHSGVDNTGLHARFQPQEENRTVQSQTTTDEEEADDAENERSS